MYFVDRCTNRAERCWRERSYRRRSGPSSQGSRKQRPLNQRSTKNTLFHIHTQYYVCVDIWEVNIVPLIQRQDACQNTLLSDHIHHLVMQMTDLWCIVLCDRCFPDNITTSNPEPHTTHGHDMKRVQLKNVFVFCVE